MPSKIKKIMSQKIGKIFVYFVFFVSFMIAGVADASSLFLYPSSGQYTVGSEFNVTALVSSPDQSINAAYGNIVFPIDKMELVSLSKDNSIFSFWVQEPSFSNSLGNASFEGVSLNPGFTGSNGQIVNLKFRVKAAGTASVNLSSGTLLANDGKGTNILNGLGNTNFTFVDAVTPVIPSVPVVNTDTDTNTNTDTDISNSPSVSHSTNTPSAPEISSPTHPDQNKWYKENNVKFTWILPSDVTNVRILYGKLPNSIPTVVYTPAITEKTLTNIEDGVWYFHVQFKNKNGWGKVSHFKFQINSKLMDTVATPESSLSRDLDDNLPYEPSPTSSVVDSSIININNLLILILLLLLFILIGTFIYLEQEYSLCLFKKRLKEEVSDTETVLKEGIELINEDIKEQEKINEAVPSAHKNLEGGQEIKVLKRDLKRVGKRVKREIKEVSEKID